MESDTTHFGYKRVAVDEKVEHVKEVFDSVADKYDLMNDVMSFGIHRAWKYYTQTMANVRPGQRILDVASGSGYLAKLFSKKLGRHGQLILTDINQAMLRRGKAQMTDAGIVDNVNYIIADAECLPFQSNYFDLISIAFGLRNVTRKERALQSMYRLLKPGGKLMILEFSKPTLPGLSQVYDAYSFHLMPLLGKWIANDEDSYRYLAESIRMHPDQDSLKSMILEAGFDDCCYHNLTGGITALHIAHKY